MINPTAEQHRLAIAEACKGEIWKQAVLQGGPLEDLVTLVADERDANAQVLLRSLGVAITPATPGETAVSVLILERRRAVAAVSPHDEDLAEKLGTPTPLKLTVLIMAHGGWSIVGVGRGVGLA